MPHLNIEAFPVSWPEGWRRTPASSRAKSQYRVTFGSARNELISHLKLFGAREIVISTNVQLKRDGLPYASTSEPQDPSVAVYWIEAVKISANEPLAQRVIACDQWQTVRENLRAVGTAVAALRQLQKTGATQVLERAFLGLKALPATTQKRAWREVFGLGVTWTAVGKLEWSDVWRRYQKVLLQVHPDTATGSREAFDELQAAYREAMDEFNQKTKP